MPDTDLFQTDKKFEGIIAGNLLIQDNSPIDVSSQGAWIDWTQPSYRQFFTYNNTATAFVGQEEAEFRIMDLEKVHDSFTQAGLLKNEEEQVQELIFQLKMSKAIIHGYRLADRILTLFNYAKEEDSSSVGIKADSLQNFIDFFKAHTDLKYPTITLTPDYNIYATWRSGKNRVFSVHFLQNGEARFVIFKPNERHPKKKVRLSGVATTDILMTFVEPYLVKDWVI